MSHVDPDHTADSPAPAHAVSPLEPAAPLDPVAQSQPAPMPRQERPWWKRFFKGTGAVAGNPAGPAQQTGGTPAP